MEVARRGENVEKRRVEGFTRDWKGDRESAEPGYRFCGCPRASVWPEHGTRCFPFYGWRKSLGKGALQRREHRSNRHRVRPAECQHSVCVVVADPAHSLEPFERRTGQRFVPLDRWRNKLEQIGRTWSTQRTIRPHRFGGGGEFGSRVRDRRSKGRWAVPLRRW